jgi:MATE family multidrug resistance protein
MQQAPGAADPVLARGPARAVFRQGLPLALGLSSHAAINLVDLAMVGRLGGDAVQAAHIGSTWNFLPMLVGNCVSTALLSRLSRELGAGRAAVARRTNLRAQWFMVWLAVGLGVLTAAPAGPMVDAMGVVGSVRADAVHYLVVSNLGCLPMFVLMQTTAAMRAAGEAAMPLLLLLGANVLNLLLIVPLLFGWSAVGLEPVGVVGAAYGSVAARTVAAAAAVAWLGRAGHALSLRNARPAAGSVGGVGRRLLVDAWPQCVQIGLRAGIVLLMTPLVRAAAGDEALIAFGIVTRFDTIVLFSSLGFANAATGFAARALVAGRSRLARLAGLWAGLQAGAFGAVVVAALLAAPAALVEACLPAPPAGVVAAVGQYFAVASWGQVAGAVALGAMGAVQGSGRMRAPLRADAFGFSVAYLLLGLAGAGAASLGGVYAAFVVGMVVVAGVHLALVWRGAWTDDRTPE